MPKFVNRDILAQLLTQELSTETGNKIKKKDAARAIDLIFGTISDTLAQGGTADISGFGKFVIFDRKSRMGINPVTKERMEIPSSRLPKFKPSQTLKNKCNPDREE